MKTRIVTGLAIGVVILAFVFLGGWWFSIFVTLMATIAMMELLKMKKNSSLIVKRNSRAYINVAAINSNELV